MHAPLPTQQAPIEALPPGTALHNGTLTIGRVLATSRLSITYVARDETLQREVAVKEFFPFGSRRTPQGQVMPPALTSPQEFTAARTRFLEEARVLARFHHPGVVSVHSFFEAAHTAYMVMELLQGTTLQAQLEKEGPQSEGCVLALTRHVGEALHAVHQAGMLHRDLKPDNIFACDDGRLVLLDFGLSTLLEADALSTRSLDAQIRFGTPGYAPPEQYTLGATQNAASDIYSLAATLYQLLTGLVPPPATDRAFGVPLEAPSRLVSGLSMSTENTLLRALRLNAAGRPQSVPEFLELLDSGARLYNARVQLLSVLNARTRQLQKAPTQRTDTRIRTQQLPEPEESGCMPLFFGAYIAVWLVGIVVCLAWLAIMFFFVRW